MPELFFRKSKKKWCWKKLEKLIRLIEWFLLWNTVLINISIRHSSENFQSPTWRISHQYEVTNIILPLFCDLNFWTFQSNKADMMGVLAEQLKLDGILNTKKIFSTEQNVAQSQFVPLSNKTNSHCNQVIAD